jgi:DNA gyrase subunit A
MAAWRCCRSRMTTIDDLIKIIPAPDFPTAGLIYGLAGVQEGYRTGRGRVVMRARTHFEDIGKGDRQAIIVDELPYQVNKKTLLEKIAELVNEKKIEGISDIRDESDKSGMRVVVELKRNEMPDVVLNNLFKQTQLQDTFGMNMVALVDGQPRLLNLRQMLDCFLAHRREVVTRRTVFELRKARERGHILEGLAVALSNVDEIIALIKAAPTPPEAKRGLMARQWRSALVEEMLSRAVRQLPPGRAGAEFGLSETGLPSLRCPGSGYPRTASAAPYRPRAGQDRRRVPRGDGRDRRPARHPRPPRAHHRDHRRRADLIKQQFGDPRRSEVVMNTADINIEDLITPQDMVVTLSHTGYFKRQPLTDYRAQKRGGRGKQAAAVKDDDFVDQLFVANTHDHILCFSNRGRFTGSRFTKCRKVPATPAASPSSISSRCSKARRSPPCCRSRSSTKAISSSWPRPRARSRRRRSPISPIPRKAGIIAVGLDDGDYLVGVAITDGQHDVMMFSDAGKAVRFSENDVRPMGRQARGVRGMMLEDGQTVIAMLVAGDEEQSVLTATENGFGKRTPIGEYTRHGRGTKGMIAIQTSDRNGKVVAATLVTEKDQIMLITTGGVLVRTRVSEIREMGRATQGVTLISVDEGSVLSGVQKILEGEEEEQDAGHAMRVTKAPSPKPERTDAGRIQTMRIFNFSAGPAVLPTAVLEQVRDELLDWHGTGMGIMEMSHRGKDFTGVIDEAEADLRELMGIPSNYRVLFLQGGATQQFAQIPMNLLDGRSADYIVTGSWSKKAYKEAQHRGSVRLAGSTEGDGFTRLPAAGELQFDPGLPTLHICTNETIHGVEMFDCPRCRQACRWWPT